MDTEPMLQLIQILEKTISSDRNELEAAEFYLEYAAVTNFTQFIKMLSDVLAQGGNSQVARMAAGLQLKNHLTSKDVTLKQQYQQRWLSLPEETRLYIKKNILAATGPEDTSPSSAAQCVAYVALAELPVGQGNELIPSLVEGARTSRFYARGALQYLAPAELAEIVPHFLPFIILNIKHEDWRFREAAVNAFDIMLIDCNETTDALKTLVEIAMPTLIEVMYDSSVAVRDAAACNLISIFIIVPEAALNETYLNPLLESLVNGLKAEPRVAASVCWALQSLAEAAYEAADCDDSNQPTTYCMSNYFDIIIQRLLETTDRQDAAQHDLRPAAYEALSQMVQNSPSDCYVTIQKTNMVILERLQQFWQMENHIYSQADRSQFDDLHSLLSFTLGAGLLKVTPEDAPQISDAIMTALLTMFASPAGKAGQEQKDAFNVVSSLVVVLGEGFLKYMDAFKRYLYVGLKNHQEYEVCIEALELTGYIFRALKNRALPYCDEIIPLLLEALGDPSIHRSLKAQILSLFGVIARNVGADFAKYFDVVMQMLLQASNAQVDRNDFAMVEYLDELRESVLKAYTGIIQGLEGAGGEVRADADVSLVEPHVPGIVDFIMTVAAEPERTDGHTQLVAGLTGHLCTVFGARVLPLLEQRLLVEQRPLLDLLAAARRSRKPLTKKLANWATEKIRELKRQPPPASWSVYHILYCWTSARCSTFWRPRAAAARRAPRTSPTGPPRRSASSRSRRRPPPGQYTTYFTAGPAPAARPSGGRAPQPHAEHQEPRQLGHQGDPRAQAAAAARQLVSIPHTLLLDQRPLLDLLAAARRSRTPSTKNLANWATEKIRELKQQAPPASWSVYHILYCWTSARCSTFWRPRAAAARRAPRTSPTGPPRRSASSRSRRRPPPGQYTTYFTAGPAPAARPSGGRAPQPHAEHQEPRQLGHREDPRAQAAGAARHLI